MGMFLQLGGILAPESQVSEAAEGLKPIFPEAFGEYSIHSEQEDRALILFDGYSSGADEAVLAISARLNCPAFWFHVHDDDLWMYRLYDAGSEIDRFNSIPGYWEPVTEADRRSWNGNVWKICKVWPGVKPEEIANYLVDHESDDFVGPEKAYETDEFEAWDCWQLVDFTAKLGIPYPPDE